MRNITNTLSLFALIFFASMNVVAQVGFGPAPYCLPQYSNKPCNQPNPSNTAGNFINDFIDNFFTTGASNNVTNNSSGCNAQIIAATSENYYFVACPVFLRVLPGQVVTCNFQSGITYDQGFAVYIDWNKNGVFANPAEQVCAPPGVPAAATPTSAAFTVPAAQAAGTYTMRVRCAYATAGPSIDPCTLYGYGETEEYRLVVGAGTVCPVVLPVELLSYSGLYRKGITELSWTTATEKNSDYYFIERSYDAKNFDPVARIPAAGNSSNEKDYYLMDKDVKENTIVYYRLREFDKGNIETFSEVLTLYTNLSNIGFEVYPNPVIDEINLLIPDILFGHTYNVEIMDIKGNIVYKSDSMVGDGSRPSIKTNDLDKGYYIVRLSDESGILMKKILVKQ